VKDARSTCNGAGAGFDAPAFGTTTASATALRINRRRARTQRRTIDRAVDIDCRSN
jgi:hypothetical protein